MSSINNFNNHGINRGVELILRRGVKKKGSNPEDKKIDFFKHFSFFGKEIYLKIQLYVKDKN